MAMEVNPMRTQADYEEAMADVARLWGAKSGTAESDRFDVLATLIDGYELQHYPIDPPEAWLADIGDGQPNLKAPCRRWSALRG